MEEVLKHGGHADQSVHGRGKGGAPSAGAGNKKLSPAQDKQMNDLAIDMHNHRQSMPMSVKTGKNTPEAQAYRSRFTQIVDQAAQVMGSTPKAAFQELNRRMGL